MTESSMNKNDYELADLSSRKPALYQDQVFRWVTDQLNQPVLISDLDGTITYANQRIAELYGYRVSELIGENPRLLNAGRHAYLDLGFRDEEYDKHFRNLWDAITNGSPEGWTGRLFNRHRNGHLVEVMTTIRPIFDKNDNRVGFIGMPRDIRPDLRALREARLRMFATLAELAEQRDPETGLHMKRVGLYCYEIATVLGFDQEYRAALALYSQLHDLGKVAIPDSILLARRDLTDSEWDMMRTHTTVGERILRKSGELEMACEIALNHHERWDGSGYPNSVYETQIPVSARIVAVADTYDAIRSERPYRPARGHAEAVQVISEESGAQFDPYVVEGFLLIHDSIRAIAEAQDSVVERIEQITRSYLREHKNRARS